MEEDYKLHEIPSFLAEPNETESDGDYLMTEDEILREMREAEELEKQGNEMVAEEAATDDLEVSEKVSSSLKDPDTYVFTSSNFERLTSKGVWLIDFYATWCPHVSRIFELAVFRMH